MLKRIISFLLFVFVFLSLFSCSENVYGHAELVIPLADSYEACEAENLDAAYEDGESVVGIIRISFDAAFNQGIPDSYMPEAFGKFYMKMAGRGNALIQRSGELAFAEYTDSQNSEGYYYLTAFYRSRYAYFVVLFSTEDSLREEKRAEFLSYAESVNFNY